ncbi:MAG: hypothetical protein E3J25_03770 [Anaerolineales bacterium]|nr:MAG: hypothetical protein E3J25_03770 [Anaerolineales bacterium]
MTRLLRAFTLAVALLALLAMVACGDDEGEGPSAPSVGEGETTPAAQVTPAPTPAAAGPLIEMGIDPEATGNTASTLGTLEPCVRVDIPSPAFDGVSDYNIDVYVKGDIQSPVAYDASVTYDQTIVHVAAPGTDDLIKMPDATTLTSETVPDSDGTFTAGVIYFAGGPGIAGDGVLLRLGLDIGGSGVVTFTLSPPPLSAYASVAGVHTVELASAQLAINQDCPQ